MSHSKYKLFKCFSNIVAEAYTELCQTSKMKRIAKTVNDLWVNFHSLTIFAKSSILDAFQSSEYACVFCNWVGEYLFSENALFDEFKPFVFHFALQILQYLASWRKCQWEWLLLLLWGEVPLLFSKSRMSQQETGIFRS